ncbi:MAG: alpha/beta fold hydrolase [Gemmataceae bacterium]
MKTAAPLLCAFLTMANLAPGADAPDTSFLKLYAETRGFMLGRPTKPKVSPDGKTVLFLRSGPKTAKNSLFEFDVATGKTRELLAPETLLKGADENLTPEEKARRERQRVSVGGFADYHLNPAGTHILVKLANSLFVFDRAANKATELKTGTDGAIVDPKWSPDGKLIGYVRGFDVYAYDLAAEKESAVTTGGTPIKTHGLAEFVAQEEMGRHSGFWWSPDSKSIAYEEADHTGVEQWFVADPLKPEVPPAPQYYPRPGKKNVAVRLGVKKLSGGDTVWMDWTSDALGKGGPEGWQSNESIGARHWLTLFLRYEYLARVAWLEDLIVIVVQTRDQRGQAFAFCDSKTGKFVTVHQSFVRDSWQNLPSELSVQRSKDLLFLSGGVLFWYSPGTNINSNGEFDASDLFGFTAKPYAAIVGYRLNPTEHQVARWDFDQTCEDGKPVILTPGPGIHTAAVGERSGVIVLTSTSLSSLPHSYVRPGDKKQLIELPSVALESSFKPNVTVSEVGDYWTAIVRPRNFDPKKKYPVIVDVYGGPKHLHVVQAMRNWLVPQWLADQGFIVVAVDNRGTPGRGAEWEKAIYKKFGTVPLEDQVKGLHALCDKFPELDRDHVGIVGWSFGGYMAANGALRRPDVFKAAVAGAPVTDWEDYDTHYTERYMGLLPESKAAYDEASLIPLAKDLKRPLLLVHGTADDNVYYRHTLKLADALFRAGRDFEQLALPGITHMYSAYPVIMERLWSKTARYFQKHLGDAK